MLLVFPYICFWLGYGTGGHFSNFGKKFELSYGMYLFMGISDSADFGTAVSGHVAVW